MQKSTMFTVYLGLWIVALCSVGMVFTYINDALQASGFFGDTIAVKKDLYAMEGLVDPTHDWGARHYWYFWMCFFLFILSVIRIVMWCEWYWGERESSKNN